MSEIGCDTEIDTRGREAPALRDVSSSGAPVSKTAGLETDSNQAIEQEVRGETERLLLRRTRIMLGMIVAGVSSGLLTDIYLGRVAEHPHRTLLHLAGISAFLVSMQALPRLSRSIPLRSIAFAGATAACMMLLAFSMDPLSRTEQLDLLGFVVVTLGTAILLPWGIWAQVALTGVVGLSILTGILINGDRQLPDADVMPSMLVAMGLSYFVALVLEKNRLTLVRQRHELAAERERAEQRRVHAEALARDLDAYAHTVAHDLKNPIFVIAGYNDLLQDELSGNVSATSQEFLEAMSMGCEKMTEIINELLLLASVRKTANVSIQQLDMPQITDEVRKRLANKIEESRAEIILPKDWPQAVGHAPWVEAVWTNYISNAIKYGGSPPRVELGADPPCDGKVHFWLRDNGEGLNEAQLSRLFEEFARNDPSKAEGHGLGLSIVKRIVERLGGEVDATSVLGQGSTFGFTLPVAL